MYSFGSGNLYGIGSAANSTPRKFGALQDVSVELSANVKKLYGQSQYALTLARGQVSIGLKAKLASLNGGIFNDLFFGQTLTTGSVNASLSESGTIPTTPFQVTVTQSVTWATDLGVYDVTAGKPLTKVASAPATGQYSVAAGVYTFAAVDVAHVVAIDYTYTVASTGGKIAIVNPLAGTTPVFQSVFNGQFQGKQGTYTFNYCSSSKLTLPTKIEDFKIAEMDITVSADASGNIGTVSWSDIA